jgi:hypothetical protein
VNRYDELARFVATQGISVDWTPRDRPTRTLGPKRAASHHEILSAEPQARDREMPLNGVLYRLIEDPQTKRGRIGIGLFDWSLAPPGYEPHQKVLINFEGAELHERIKDLIGEAVEAVVVAHEPRLGTAVSLERIRPSLVRIDRGKGSPADYGFPLFELEED